MTIVKEVLQVWADIGLLDVILPFAVVFTIVWSVLEKTKVLGPKSQQYNTVVAFVLGFLVIAALHLIDIITTVMQWSAFAVVAFTFILILGKFMGGFASDPTKTNYPKWLALIAIAIIAAYALGFSGVFNIDIVERWILPLGVAFGFVALVVWAVIRPGGPVPTKKKPSSKRVQHVGSFKPEGEKKL
ncbi:hypothetical protein GF342_00590 [Candidatus Woesearchaeota archaeon]|nr:hypothetical protein [Candidatus Woesearchaeota archaeon]